MVIKPVSGNCYLLAPMKIDSDVTRSDLVYSYTLLAYSSWKLKFRHWLAGKLSSGVFKLVIDFELNSIWVWCGSQHLPGPLICVSNPNSYWSTCFWILSNCSNWTSSRRNTIYIAFIMLSSISDSCGSLTHYWCITTGIGDCV